MKKLTILICVLAMLLALTGVASADPPPPEEFTIEDELTSIETIFALPSGLVPFDLTAEGDVSGDSQGTFRYGQWSIEEFTITGYTTFYEYETLPSGRIKFHLTTQGGGDQEPDELCQYLGSAEYGVVVSSCQELCLELQSQPCGVTDYFEGGTFTFEEWGIVDLASGRGINVGIMTITTGNSGTVDIAFAGRAVAETVRGYFRVRDGTGAYEHLHGWGRYTGDAGLVFTVEFTGRFCTARR